MRKEQGLPDFVKLEKDILKFWDDEHCFEAMRAQNSKTGKWYPFLDGPITANNEMKLDLTKISGAKKNVWWYSVTDGSLKYVGQFDNKVQTFHYDGAYGAGNDHVLIAVDADKDYIQKDWTSIPRKD